AQASRVFRCWRIARAITPTRIATTSPMAKAAATSSSEASVVRKPAAHDAGRLKARRFITLHLHRWCAWWHRFVPKSRAPGGSRHQHLRPDLSPGQADPEGEPALRQDPLGDHRLPGAAQRLLRAALRPALPLGGGPRRHARLLPPGGGGRAPPRPCLLAPE